jgi:ribosomal protein S18 acetylase RimI-like enzyme
MLRAVEIRRLGPDDTATLARALLTFRGPDDRPDPGFLADVDGVVFVASEGDDVLGWAWGHELHRPNGMRTLLLYEIEVVEAQRPHGLGRRLLDTFVAHARGRGLARMWLFTDAGNEAANRLYAGAGGIPGPKVGYWWVFE